MFLKTVSLFDRLQQLARNLFGASEGQVLTCADRRRQVAVAIMIGLPVGLGFAVFNQARGFVRQALV